MPVSARKDIIRVDFDSQLDTSDFDNLKTSKLLKSSEVYNSNTIAKTLDLRKTYNRVIGQKLGESAPSKNSQLKMNQN